MAAAALEIDWLPVARIAQLQRFLDAEWRAGHVLARDEDLLRWQHPRSEDELSFVAASEGDELLGVLGVIPIEVGAHGRRIDGAWLTTWVVVPAARPRRIGLELLEFVLSRSEFVGTIGGNPSTTTILRALRFETRSAIPRWIRPLDQAALARLGGKVHPVPEPEATVGNGFRVRAWSDTDAGPWDRYWNAVLAPALVGTWRDAGYLSWRYLSHPRFDYRIQIAESEAGEPAGIIVYRLERTTGANELVVRVLEALGDERAVAALAAQLVESGRALGAAFADFYCTSGRFARPLETVGFFLEETNGTSYPSRLQPLEPRSRPLTASLRLAHDEAELLAGPDVYFTRSDCDQDRPS